MAMPPASPEVIRFAHDIERAIKLRELFFQFELDRSFQEQGGRVIYAVDANVLNQYFRVSDQPKKVNWRLFGVFLGPPGTSGTGPEAQIREVVTSFVLNSLDRGDSTGEADPLILLPGHSDEAKKTYESVVNAFNEQLGKGRRVKARLVELMELLGKASPQRRLEVAREHEAELHQLLYSVESPHQKLRAYNQLLARKRLLTLERALANRLITISVPGEGEAPSAGSLPSEPGGEGSGNWWEDRLVGRMRPRYAEIDKTALAALDAANRRLRHQETRMILLTLNDEIAAVGHRYRPYKYQEGELGRYHFSDLYIRHMRGFLSRPDIIRPTSNEVAADVSAWLDAFLVRVTRAESKTLLAFRRQVPRSPDAAYLYEIAAWALDQWPELHQSLYDDWQSHLNNVALAHVSTSSQASRRIIDLLGKEDQGHLKVVREFEDHIRQLTEDSWNDFFLTAARSGYEMIGLSPEKTRGRKRNVPVVFFRDLSVGQRLLKMIYEPDGVIRNERDIRALLLGLDERGGTEASYTSAMCYALLFAFADRWVVAKLLARKAIYIAKKDPPCSGADASACARISGREANYLAAVTHRLTARSQADLGEASAFLQAAKKSFEEEPEPARDPADESPRMTGLRFAAEAAAIETANLIFDAFATSWDLRDRSDLLESARQMVSRIAAILTDDCGEEFVRKTTFINLRANLFSCMFLLECGGQIDAGLTDDLEELAEAQVDDIAEIYSAESTALNVSPLDFYSILYAFSFSGRGAADDDRLVGWGNLLGELSDLTPESFLMPYDRERCIRMEASARARLGLDAEIAAAPTVQ